MNVFVPEASEAAVPRHLRISDGMVEELLYRPDMAIKIFFGAELDAFQGVRTKWIWFGQNVDDQSGISSGKTVEAWWLLNLAALLKPDHRGMVVYPNFQMGKETFWEYYQTFGTPLFRAQLGRMAVGEDEEEGVEMKSNLRGGSMWTQYFRNRSQVKMPAPNFGKQATTLASIRLNWLWLEEANKILGTDGGFSGATKQLLGRVTRQTYNKYHPIWWNRVTYSSTRELGNHPAEKIHKNIEQKRKQGSPLHHDFAFCFKDYSNLPVDPPRAGAADVAGYLDEERASKSFRDVYRDDGAIARVLEVNSEEAGLAEAFGVGGLQGEDWFEAGMLDGLEELGVKREVKPVMSRMGDERAREVGQENVFYFGGVDPAPAKGPKNDFGAVAVLRAILLPGRGGENETDYELDLVYLRKVRNYKAGQWSGLIHEKHGDFRLERIVIDLGGGGEWIIPELREARQLVDGVMVERKPIIEFGFPMVEGDPVLVSLRAKDLEIARLFPDLKNLVGPEWMKDLVNTMFQTAVGKGILALPKPYKLWKQEEMAGWMPDRVWALRWLSLVRDHMGNVVVPKEADGRYKLSARGAKLFEKKGRDDFHDAFRNAYIGFRCWLATRVAGMGMAGCESGGCLSW